MTIKKLVTWITFLAVFAMAVRISMDTDSWWHLRTGQWILDNGRIPLTDPFSYTRLGQPWRIPGWLVQVPMTWMYNTGGPGLLNLWVAGMVTLAFWFIYRVLDGGVFTKAFIVVLGAATAGVYWAARPYMMTFLLTAAFLWILEDWRAGRKDRLWWLPLLMVVWANSHGGFAVGVIIWGVYFVGAIGRVIGAGELGRTPGAATDSQTVAPKTIEAARRAVHLPHVKKIFVVGVVMAAAIALNPFGPEMLLYPFKTVGIDALRDFIQEWQSPNFTEPRIWPFAAMLVLIPAAAIFSQQKLYLEEVLLVVGWGALSLWASRNIATFALAGMVVLARHAAPIVGRWQEALGLRLRLGRKPTKTQSALNAVLVVLVGFAVLIKAASVYPEKVNREAFAAFLPLDAVAFIQEEMPEGRMFSSYNWGAYLLWELPEYPVFVDGRTDLYNDEVIAEWFKVVWAEEGWEEVLDYWGVKVVMVESGSPISKQLPGQGWDLIYESEQNVIYKAR